MQTTTVTGSGNGPTAPIQIIGDNLAKIAAGSGAIIAQARYLLSPSVLVTFSGVPANTRPPGWTLQVTADPTINGVWNPTNWADWAIPSGNSGTLFTQLPGLVTGLRANIVTPADLTSASGSITFSTIPSANQTITLNGTAITFVSGTPSGNQVQISGSLSSTILAVATLVGASADPNLLSFQANMSAAPAPTTSVALNLYARTSGSAGNSLTLATTVTNAVVAAMSGGGNPAYGGSVNLQVVQ